MNDCVNAEMRDQLPDLLHDRLDRAARAAVMAHVDGCTDCRAELELLRRVHATLTNATPRIDVGRIVQALPSRRPARSLWMHWRVAAAAVLIVAAGTSVTLMTRKAPLRPDTVLVARTDAPNVTPPAGVPVQPTTAEEVRRVDSQPTRAIAPATEVAAERGIEMTGGLSDLTDEELQLLLQEIDELQAVPLTEPEPAVIPVTSKRTVSPTGT